MKPASILAKIKKHRPIYECDFEDLTGHVLIPTHGLGAIKGCFREAHHMIGTNFVVKFPLTETYTDKESGELCETRESGIKHSQIEMRAHKMILLQKRFRHLRPFLPHFFYTDYHEGVIVVERLKECNNTKAMQVLEKVFTATFGRSCDIFKNCGLDKNDNIKVYDLGCVNL